jgi:hypothetical protein
VESRTRLKRTFAALAALTLAIAPAWSAHVARSRSVRGDPIAISAGAPAPEILAGIGTAAPEAEIRPTDERDPTPPLPASAVVGVLLSATAVLGALRRAPGGRIRPLRWALVHTPRAPPALPTT